MKKSIIALAVAAASMAGVAQADNTTLYGSIRMAAQVNDDGTDTSLRIANGGSRIGVKGSDDLGNGLKAIYRFEWGANIFGSTVTANGEGLATRLGWVGLTGSFGTVKLGRQWSPYYNVAGYNDLFNDQFYNHYQGVFRLSNAFSYTTPDMSGFKVAAAITADGAAGNDEVVDNYNIAAIYDNNGIFAGLTYLSTNGLADEQTKLAAALGYSNDMFRIGLTGEQSDNGGSVKPMTLTLAGEYYLNDMDTIRAGIAVHDYDVAGRDEAMEAAIGYQHKFSKRTRVWAEYGYQDSGVSGADSTSKLSLGLRTDF